MKALLTKAFADLKRRRLQTAVVLLIVLLAAGTATLALTLMQQTSDPYDCGFRANPISHSDRIRTAIPEFSITSRQEGSR
jgi:hypothetical protein